VPTTSYIDIVIEKYEAANEREFFVRNAPGRRQKTRYFITTSHHNKLCLSFSLFWPPMWSVEGEISSGTRVLPSKSQSPMVQTEAFMIRQASCSMRITRITGHRESRSLFIASPWNGFCHGRAENGLIPVD
jgi:hypothetical protein